MNSIYHYRNTVFVFILFIIISVNYIPSMKAGYIWDDDMHVTENTLLRNQDGLRKIWFQPGAWPQYYPMVLTSFWAQYHLWGLNASGYHGVNILIHAVNALLLWLILGKLKIRGRYIAVMIFAIHPVYTESVSWISEHKNILSGFFYLSSLFTYLHYIGFGTSSARQKRVLSLKQVIIYLFSMILFMFALFSKTVTCSLPAVILLLMWWKKDRITIPDILALVPFFVIGAVLGLNTVWMEKNVVGASGSIWELSFIDRILIAGRAVFFYIRTLIWPDNIIFIYPKWSIDSGVWWQYIYPIICLLVIFLLWLKRQYIGKSPLVAVLIFCGTLFPALGFFDLYPMRFSFVADHFQYLASISIITLFSSILVMLVSKLNGTQKSYITIIIFCAVFISLGLITWREQYKYRNEESLWEDTLMKNSQAAIAHGNLGLIREKQQSNHEAMNHYLKALQIDPNYMEAHFNIGSLYMKKGNLDKSMFHYSEALRLKPNNYKIHFQIGKAYQAQNLVGKALYHYDEALRYQPSDTSVYLAKGDLLSKIGKINEAIINYREVLKIQPGNIHAYIGLGTSYTRAEMVDNALSSYQHALTLEPRNESVHYNMGVLFYKIGRLDEAVQHFHHALCIKPRYVDAYINLGGVYSRMGNIDDAIKSYIKALALNSRYPGLHFNLGLMLAKQNRLEESVYYFSEALRIDPDLSIAKEYIEKINQTKRGLDY